MDAVEFLKEYQRMCRKECEECPLNHKVCLYDNIDEDNLPFEEIVEATEQWSQSHPQKTMIQDFFEKFPNAPKEEDGTPINICPSYFGYTDEPNSLSICEKFNNNCIKCWSRPLRIK